ADCQTCSRRPGRCRGVRQESPRSRLRPGGVSENEGTAEEGEALGPQSFSWRCGSAGGRPRKSSFVAPTQRDLRLSGRGGAPRCLRKIYPTVARSVREGTS